MARGGLALAAVWSFARAIDLARDPRSHRWWQRMALAVGIFDTREATAAPQQFEGRALAAALAHGALAVGLLLAATVYAETLSGAGRWALRWSAGIGFVYAVPEAVAATLRFVFALLGVRIPELHRVPLAARSLGEFWGQRWNRTVGAWLRRHCFMPLARRRRPGLGLAAAFLASTALHAWFAGVAVGRVGALSMGAYFVVQGVLVGLESRVRPGVGAGRAWAILGAGVPAPLFVEPVLWIFEPLVIIALG